MGSGSTNELGAGTTFGSYRVVRRLAVGGTAEVFLALDASGARHVLKVPFESAARDTDRNEAIAHEAAIGARLVHPAIVRIEGIAREGSRLALVEEYVDGISLEALLDGARLSHEVAIRILVDLAHALDVAHGTTDADGAEIGLVHRDLHPRNVLVSRRGDVKLLDFGIARSRLAAARTKTGTLKGTLRYLAPEQATSSELDRRTDVYALGLLGFEMLAHEPYLVGSNDVELLRAAENPSPRSLGEDVPPEVRSAIERALARFPEERFGTAIAFAKRVERFAGDADAVRESLAATVTTLAPPEEVHPAPAETGRRRSGSVARSAGIVVVIAIASTLFVSRTTRAPQTTTVVPPAPSSVPAVPAPETPSARTETNPPETSPEARPSPIDARAQPPRPTGERPTPPADLQDAPPPVASTPPESPPDVVPIAAPSRDAIRAKLARADAALRSARGRGDDVSRAEALSREALSAYVEGRYVDADRLLDGILSGISPP